MKGEEFIEKKPKEFTLDTSDVRPIGASSVLPGDDSFAAEYRRFVETESSRLLEEGEQISVSSYYGQNAPGGDMADAANRFFAKLSQSVSRHMQEYLLEHGGRVKQWADPAGPDTFRFEQSDDLFQYDYFGGLYRAKNGKILCDAGHFYNNYYRYPERDPNLLVNKLEREFYRKNDRGQFLKQEESAAKAAESALEKAKQKDDAIGNARMGLILVAILAVRAGLATARGVGLPVDLQPIMDACVGFFKGVWSTLPKVLNLLACALLAIPLYAVVILLAVAQIAGTIIFDFSALGAAYSIVCLVVVWGAVGAAALVLGVHRAFWKNPLPAAQAAYDAAQAALAQKQAEYERMENEWKSSERYQNAQREDREQTAADQARKAANEAFAERWQRAWFEAVQERDRRLAEKGKA